MNDNITESLNKISDILSNYDDTYYTLPEIREIVLTKTIDEIINEFHILSLDLNKIRDIVNELQEDNNE